MATYYEDFEIDQGADVALTINLTEPETNAPRNLAGVTPSAKMKINYAADTGVSFNAIVANPSTDGIVTLELTNEQTSALNARWRYVYDLVLAYVDSDSAGITEPVLRGTIKVNPGVTGV